ncbi:MAG: nicotinate phosphoribosyltransferase [candidate division KSB1 bacterium]|nr:nicotinate phosphoribosyltransferase [candidate division KSB1 bacterium]
MFHVATAEEIKSGKVTDVYFQRTREILEARGIDKRVTAEFVVKSFPQLGTWGVLAGIEECLELLKGLTVRVRAMAEGTIFGANQPVLEIEGQYLEFGVYETALLGLLCQASGVATKAARCRKLARNKPLISFGARRMHPAVAPMIERSAYIGGCDGVAAIKSAEIIGITPTGTMPHALILIMGDTVEATRAFDEIIDKKVPRIALIDTFQDEKFEAIRVAEALGPHLYGVRLDTPLSRRGDFVSLLQEIRWELNLRGYSQVKLFVSGGIDERQISELNQVVDAYGVGTTLSSAPVLDFAMDIVEIEGRPLAKRGKASGRKSVWRCPQCYKSLVTPRDQRPEKFCRCEQEYQDLLQPLVDSGEIKRKLPSPQEIRNYVLDQLKHFEVYPYY